MRKQRIVASLLELQRVATDADAAGLSQMIVDLIASRPPAAGRRGLEASFTSENRALQLWQGLLTRVLGTSLAAGQLAAEQRLAAADELWLRGRAGRRRRRAPRRLDALVRSTVQTPRAPLPRPRDLAARGRRCRR